MTMMPSLDLLMRLRKEWVQVINKMMTVSYFRNILNLYVVA